MKILFIGDISGKPGRETVKKILPNLRSSQDIDFVIANAENAAGGRGVTLETLNELTSYGIDFFTSGEHVWDIKSFRDEIRDENLSIVRPLNYEASAYLPGKGIKEIDLGSKGRLFVTSFLGQTFMRDNVRSPFWVFDELYNEYSAKWAGAAVIIDFHAEATSEKLTFGNYVKDKVSAVLGTHTHVPTIDPRMFGNTGYITDVGMTGPYEASLWVKFEDVLQNFKYPYKTSFTIEEEGKRSFNSVLVEFEANEDPSKPMKCISLVRIDKLIET